MGVQEHYANYVTSGGDGTKVLESRAVELGYGRDFVPNDLFKSQLFQASCGSGCPLRLPGGRPNAADQLVMDFGCGAGHDVLLASQLIIDSNNGSDAKESMTIGIKKVIGVDMTAEMIAAAEDNLNRHPELKPYAEFVEARLEDPGSNFMSEFGSSVDLIYSNGVFNLCQDKLKVFQVVFKLLKPGGRFVFSDAMKLPCNEINPNAPIATSIDGDEFCS